MGDIFIDQITTRRDYDEGMYQNAMNDLLSILNIKSVNAVKKIKGAIAEILNYINEEVPEIPENIDEIDSELEYMLKPSGTMKRRVELIGEWWKDSIGCLLASTKDGKVVALLQDDWGNYFYHNDMGEIIKINKSIASNINIDAFCFYKSFPLSSLKIMDLLKFLFKNISKSDILFILISFLVTQLLGMASPIITKIIYDKVIPSGDFSIIFTIFVIMLGISITSTITSISKNLILEKITSKLNISVNSATIMRMFSLPAKFFKKYSSGELASIVGHVASFCQLISGSILSSILFAMFSLGYFFQMNYYAPKLVLPALSITFASIAFYVIMTIMRHKINNSKMKLSPKLQSLIFSLFSGIQKIKITGAEKRAFSKWSNSYSKIEKLDYSPPFIMKISDVISTLISSAGTIIIYYYAISIQINTSNYLAFISAYGSVSFAITSISSIILQISNLKPVINLIKPFMDEIPESNTTRKLVTSLSGNIEINNLSFKYSDEGPMILKNLSVKIKKGEYIAIVGKTGCGKSTILRLLLGFEKAEVGGIYYGGRDINSLDIVTLRQKIGVVMQNGTIFPGDIFSNIIITSPWKNMDDAWEAASISGLDVDIKNMPMGMHTLISEGAGGISGGQKQRLMIARAVISSPSILFLDEATSALDNITQKHVSDSLEKLNCTRLVIAHRLSTVKKCDRILVLKGGEICEEGNYEYLMKKKGEFYDLAIRQIADP